MLSRDRNCLYIEGKYVDRAHTTEQYIYSIGNRFTRFQTSKDVGRAFILATVASQMQCKESLVTQEV